MRVALVILIFVLLAGFASAQCVVDDVVREDVVLDSSCSYDEIVVSGDVLVDCNSAYVGNVKIKGGDVRFKDCDFVEDSGITGYSVTEVEGRSKPVLVLGVILGVFVVLTFYRRKFSN